MSASDLKRWMKENGKNEIDIASVLKVNPITVKRFLSGKRVQPIIQAALESMVKSTPAPSKAVAG